MTTSVLFVVLVIGAVIAYLFPDTRKVVYLVFGVCALIWVATAFGVLPSRLHLP